MYFVKFSKIFIVTIVLLSSLLFAQQNKINWVTIEQPMPDFTLPAYQGEEVTFSQLQGKNVMLIFPRGYASKNYWCPYCIYRYMELLDFEIKQQIRKKYNMEIVYVFPYGKDELKDWFDKIPEVLATIEQMKNPPKPDKRKMFTKMIRNIAPKSFNVKSGEITTPFPILLDEQRKVSKRLGIFKTELSSGSKVDQNIPSVYIIDQQGILQFKYISQHTFDRPGFDYLFKILSNLNQLQTN